jgi:hypothetical protein
MNTVKAHMKRVFGRSELTTAAMRSCGHRN